MAEPLLQTPPLDLDADFLERALDRKDLARLEDVVERAERILGRSGETVDAGAAGIALLAEALEARLVEGGAAPSALTADRQAHERQLGRLRERFLRRQEALRRAEEAAGRLREITAPATILEVAPQRLCEATRLERTILSTVRDGAMVVTAASFDDDPDGAADVLAKLSDHRIRLEHPLLEAEMIRRRRATAVVDPHHPRVDPRLNEAMGWHSYLVAPVVVRGQVVAVLHGDIRSGQPDVLDREALWRFAVGLAQAYERATLRRLLRQEREQMRGFLDRLNVRLGDLSDRTIQLAPRNERPAGDPRPIPRQRPSDHSTLSGLLTTRELEVLSLLARGISNQQIADELVISRATVKFHINSLLKKLRAANRAEAVSRFLAAGGVSP